MTELVGYCYWCSNCAVWNDKLQKMTCLAYMNGIPDSMWKRVEQGKQCIWRAKDRVTIEHEATLKKIEEIKKMNLPDDEKAKLFDEWLAKQNKD